MALFWSSENKGIDDTVHSYEDVDENNAISYHIVEATFGEEPRFQGSDEATDLVNIGSGGMAAEAQGEVRVFLDDSGIMDGTVFARIEWS